MKQVEIGSDGLTLMVDGNPIVVIDRRVVDNGFEIHMVVHKNADRGPDMPYRHVCIGVHRNEGFECSAPTRMDCVPVTYNGPNMDAEKARLLYKIDYKASHSFELMDDEILVKELVIKYEGD